MPKVNIKQSLKIILPLLFGLCMLWLLYRNLNLGALLTILKRDANWWVIFGSSLFGTMGNAMRAFRWDITVQALRPNRSTLLNAHLTTQGNYAVNMLLPRLGEVWRCATMRLYSGLPFTQLFGTLIVDRAFDLIAALVLMLIATSLNFPFLASFFQNHPELWLRVQSIMISPWFYSSLLLLLSFCIGGYFLLRHTGMFLPLRSLFLNIWQGVLTLKRMKRRWAFLWYTILIWLCYFLQFYLTFYAFSFMEGLGPEVALMAFVLITIAVAAPVQAGMGAWHFMVIYALLFFGVARDNASSFALIVHTFQTMWTTLVGLVAILLLPLLNKRKRAAQV